MVVSTALFRTMFEVYSAFIGYTV
uniref:Uncharacterized protein n=1 Tax=Anguilla anguilla TaxID=7936 RepID=A0A0E9RW52_ANGAN